MQPSRRVALGGSTRSMQQPAPAPNDSAERTDPTLQMAARENGSATPRFCHPSELRLSAVRDADAVRDAQISKFWAGALDGLHQGSTSRGRHARVGTALAPHAPRSLADARVGAPHRAARSRRGRRARPGERGHTRARRLRSARPTPASPDPMRWQARSWQRGAAEVMTARKTPSPRPSSE